MVKPFVMLASRVIRVHQEITPCITRIQTGFMREKNMEEVEKMLEEMQKMLRDMREALKTPNKQQDDYIPLK
jgi:hypothetical protein